MALVYATSPRGACHNQSDYYIVEIGQTMEEIGVRLHGRREGLEKVQGVVRHQNWRTLGNALVLCQFANVEPEDLRRLVHYVTGFDYGLGELLEVGERGWTMKRAVNHRLGLQPEDDRLPPHLLRPLGDGPAQGYVPPFDEMIQAYYYERGWDPESGRPTPDRLGRLGLESLIPDLWGETAANSSPPL
jgi:aldehyde:ferredoxin oxidoreductase